MSVVLVNGHILIPHLPDWSSAVSHRRQWQTNVEAAITGAEHRRAVRTSPRITLGWHLVPFDVADQARLQARLRAARKSGYSCARRHSRGPAYPRASGLRVRGGPILLSQWRVARRLVGQHVVDSFLHDRRQEVVEPTRREAAVDVRAQYWHRDSGHCVSLVRACVGGVAWREHERDRLRFLDVRWTRGRRERDGIQGSMEQYGIPNARWRRRDWSWWHRAGTLLGRISVC